MSLALQHLWLSAVALGVAVFVMRRQTLGAEARSWLLLALLAASVLVPIAAVVPRSPTGVGSAAIATARAASPPPSAAGVDEPIAATAAAGQPIRVAVPPTFAAALALVWLLGALVPCLRLYRGVLRARRLRQAALPAPALEALCGEALPRGVRIAVTADAGPMLVGLRRPCILVPEALVATLDAAALADVLRHEIAHVRRGDLWSCTLERIALAMFWWNPLLRRIADRLDLARETACDARAAGGAASELGYAESLFASVEQLLAAPPRAALAVGMLGHGRQLESRIDSLIARAGSTVPRRHYGAAEWGTAALVLIIAALAAPPRVHSAATRPAASAVARVSAKAEPDARIARLVAAVASDEAQRVRDLVAAGVDIDGMEAGHGTALMYASWNNDLEMARLLLSLGADPDRGAPGKGSPLVIAAGLGHRALVELLVEAGADVNRGVRYAGTPLVNALRNGEAEVAEYLLDRGARFDVPAEPATPQPGT